MSNVDFNSPEIQKLLERVEKLLRLASNNPNEAEAASAAAKAQEILALYQLDMSAVEQASGRKSNDREDRKLKGGLYKWQRSLWQEVAKLNFCLYWSIKGLTKGSAYEHRVIGRKANIIGTRMMAEYIEQAIERITREHYSNQPSIYFSKAGIAYREGMSDRICERLRERRREQEREELAKQQARQTATGPSTSTALTIVDVTKSEHDANREFEYDLQYGPGAYAEMKHKQKAYWDEQNRMQAEADAAKQAWIDANPEEHARQEAARKAREEKEYAEWLKREARNARRRKGSYRYSRDDMPRHGDYYAGHERGADVSLDRQIDNRQDRKIGG